MTSFLAAGLLQATTRAGISSAAEVVGFGDAGGGGEGEGGGGAGGDEGGLATEFFGEVGAGGELEILEANGVERGLGDGGADLVAA